jgi:hypothetical protein
VACYRGASAVLAVTTLFGGEVAIALAVAAASGR